MIFMNFLSRNSRATGPKMRVPFGFFLCVNDYACIVIKADVRAITAPRNLPSADNNSVVNFALFHRAIRRGDFDVNFDHIANSSIALVASQHADVPSHFRACIVGYIKMRSDL